MKKFRIAIIGRGRQGQRYVDTLSHFNVDIVSWTGRDTDYSKLFSQDIDGLIVATSPHSHLQIAELALNENIPVLLEKPVSLSSKGLDKFLGAPVFVDYTHLYAYGFQSLLYIDPLEIRYIDACFAGPGPTRDFPAVMDYAIHPIVMALSILHPESWYYDRNNCDHFKIVMDKTPVYITAHNEADVKIQRFDVHTKDKIFTYDGTQPHRRLPLNMVIEEFLFNILNQVDNSESWQLTMEATKILEGLSVKTT